MSRRSLDETGEAVLRARATGLLRQARRAGRVVIGVRQTGDAAREGRLAAVLVAEDLAGSRRAALLDRLRGAGVKVYRGWTKDELGELAGRVAVAAFGITDRHIAAGLARLTSDYSTPAKESNEEDDQGD